MIRFRPEAARELTDDVRYYDERYAGRGQRFAREVDRLLERIASAPASFPILIEPGIRSAKVPRFPYRIVFIEVGAGADIDVLAVAHAKRRPTYWRRRLT